MPVTLTAFWVNPLISPSVLNLSGEQIPVVCVRNVMAHAQKPDFVFRRNEGVHLNRRGRQFSRLLAAEFAHQR